MAQESLVPYNAVHNEKRVRNTAWLFFRFSTVPQSRKVNHKGDRDETTVV